MVLGNNELNELNEFFHPLGEMNIAPAGLKVL